MSRKRFPEDCESWKHEVALKKANLRHSRLRKGIGPGKQCFVGADGATCADVSPDGDFVAMAFSDHTVRVYKTHTGFLRLAHKEHGGPVSIIFFSECGQFVYSYADEDSYVRFDIRSGRAHADKEHESAIVAMRKSEFIFSDAKDTCILLFKDGTKMLDIFSLKPKHMMRHLEHPDVVSNAAFPRGSKDFVVTACRDGCMRIIQTDSGDVLRTMSTGRVPLVHARFTLNGQSVVATSEQGEVYVIDLTFHRKTVSFILRAHLPTVLADLVVSFLGFVF